jgi:hypothetical protein
MSRLRAILIGFYVWQGKATNPDREIRINANPYQRRLNANLHGREAIKKRRKEVNMKNKIISNSLNTTLLPTNLQFFAEPGDPAGGSEPGEPAGGDPAGSEPGEPAGGDPASEVTVESLVAQLSEMKAENAKLKSTNDKLCQSEGQLRKQLRAKMTAEEEAAEIKAEEEAKHNEYVSGLEKKLAIIEATAKYVEMGFDPKLAAETATADYEGDKDTVNANIKKMMSDQRKKMEAELREQLLKDIPAPQSGNQGNVDYSKQISDSINGGDFHSATLAILAQAQSQSQ